MNGHGPAGDGDAVPRTTGRAPRGERGSQALELALAAPFVALLLVGVLAGAAVALQQVLAQQLAGVGARVAAVDGDAAVRSRIAAVAGPDVAVEVTPGDGTRRPGDLVEVVVRVPPRVAVPGLAALVGRAVAQVEDVPGGAAP